MKILVMSPIELPYTVGSRYTGLERLAVQHAERWALNNEVAIIAHKDTNVAPGVKLLPCDGYETIKRPDHAEIHAFNNYQSEVYNYDVIWDISHLHLISRFMVNRPTVSIFGANPEYEAHDHHAKAPYNLISWSKWGVGQIRRFYHQEARYQETIMIDPTVYKPGGCKTDRFLTIGRMAEAKGNLEAATFCKNNGLKLDIAGGRGSEKLAGADLTDYEKQVMSLCDGNDIVYHGEVSEEEKISLMQSCRALLYMTNHVEITSHKIQECMLCGAPVIVPNHGGFPEIVTQGVDGFLCSNLADYEKAILNLKQLEPFKTREQVAHKYHPDTASRDYIKLFERVANGERWK